MKNKKRKSRFKFKVGDTVRISHLKKTFEKGYVENWTLEYFKINKRLIKNQQDIYRLVDMTNDPIKGTFYRYELQKIKPDDTNTYKIEKILEKRRN